MLTLPKHNRYDYSVIGERKDYSWPGGKRLASSLRHPVVPARSAGLEGRRPECCHVGAVHPSRLGLRSRT